MRGIGARLAIPRARMARLMAGMPITLVASVRLFHHLFVEKRSRLGAAAGA
ncbi:hypothetical protein LY474_26465 [Myxococcus stipitatus]|uniref:hypothetical protein n=1 Tax=Myxococcus stipitatus TaxID=83455 RepID=UPI001F484118|nr:hypothetical protein [Myxococcus stipitatus]MCE9671355.1 hypothetical protein [Myxococcus stipitatus]